MRRTLVVLTLVALIALAAAGPALAANGPNDKAFFTLVGIVTDITNNGAGDLDAITVRIYHGNRFAQPLIGQDLPVDVDETTEFRRWTPFGCVPADPSIVDPGDTISIHGMVVDNVFHGDRVTVDVPLDCCTP